MVKNLGSILDSLIVPSLLNKEYDRSRLYNVLDSSAYLRKWYKGTTLTWNQVADGENRRIYIKSLNN